MLKDHRGFPYIPNSEPSVKTAMLEFIGAQNEMDLYEEIPEHIRFRGKLNLPEPIRDEYNLKRHTEKILSKNRNCSQYLNFIGAGCAQHFVPAVCDEIIGRGEFLTSYGAEGWADHGKHMAFFEFQSQLAELLDMDFITVPVYDGAQAIGTGLCMSNRINGRKKVLLPANMDPQNLAIVTNYLASVRPENALQIELINYNNETGLLDIEDLQNKIGPDVAAVLLQNPNYFGLVEGSADIIGQITREVGAEYLVYTDPISLGVMEAPANYGATITVGDIHTLGLHLSGGAGVGGFVATFDDMKYMEQTKDLVDGITATSVEGEYGFGMVLIERTHYARREKGNEFTGTGVNLWAINSAVYMALMGPKGFEEVGQTIMQNSQYAAKKLAAIQGVEIKFTNPFFKEFVVNFDKTDKKAAEVIADLLQEEIFAGKDISGEFPHLGQNLLVCVTEVHDKADIDRFTAAIAKSIGSQEQKGVSK
ncbi:MAG: aminomethyl-transferring glycine dehydrogenase subunit GcvPA [Bacillota bacterium]|jgi:glycine dehydrogenase subunit 1